MEKDFAKKEEKLNVALKLKEEEVSKLTVRLCDVHCAASPGYSCSLRHRKV